MSTPDDLDLNRVEAEHLTCVEDGPAHEAELAVPSLAFALERCDVPARQRAGDMVAERLGLRVRVEQSVDGFFLTNLDLQIERVGRVLLWRPTHKRPVSLFHGSSEPVLRRDRFQGAFASVTACPIKYCREY